MTREPHAASPPVPCVVCAYDLRATPRDGCCPECGTPAIESFPPHGTRLRCQKYIKKRLLVTAIVLVIAIVTASRFESDKSAWICTECARSRLDHVYSFTLPLSKSTLFDFKFVGSAQDRSITSFLDDSHRCSHRWRTYGSDWTSWRGRARGIGVYPALCAAPRDPLFSRFVASDPTVLDRARTSLANGEYLSDWLDDEFRTWKYAASGENEIEEEVPSGN